MPAADPVTGTFEPAAVVPADPAKPLGQSQAPYDTSSDDQAHPPRQVLGSRRPWREAGRSTRAQARRVLADKRALSRLAYVVPDREVRRLQLAALLERVVRQLDLRRRRRRRRASGAMCRGSGGGRPGPVKLTL